MKLIKNRQFHFRQKGFALVEVLVSVFVLALGILALLATQVRSVSSVREAETQTIAAQAAQNLIEGMLSNPSLVQKGNWTEKNYDRYIGNTATNPGQKDTYTPAELAQLQVFNFSQELSTGKLGDMGVKWTICQTGSLDDTNKPEIKADGTFDPKCSGTGNVAVKIAWLLQPDKNNANPQSVGYQTYVRDNQ